MVVGGFVWLRLFELDRTCFGCFQVVFDCSGLCWIVLGCFGCNKFFKFLNVV